MPKSRPTPEITKKVMQSPFFIKTSQFTALPGKIANHGFFYKISLGKNGFWTKINVHFGSANHFLCFDILSRSENPYQKTSKKQPPYKDLRKSSTIHSRVVSYKHCLYIHISDRFSTNLYPISTAYMQ